MISERQDKLQKLDKKHEKFMQKLTLQQRKKLENISWKDGSNYIAVRKLGQGGFSMVFQCINTNNSRRCAVKILTKQSLATIHQQIEVLIHLNGKCGFIELLDLVKIKNSYCLIFEYLQVKPYHQVLCTLKPKQSKFYLYQFLLSIFYCHSKSIMHRDLKPHNIGIDLEKKRIKLFDLGLAQFYEENRHYRTMAGTLVYHSPENLLGYYRQTPATDIWTFGVIMAGMLSGKQPFFPARSEKKLFEEFISFLGNSQLNIMIKKYSLIPKQSIMKLLEEPIKPLPLSFIMTKSNQKYLTPDAIDLIQKILKYDPLRRPTALQCIRHKYFDDVREYCEEELYQLHKQCGILQESNFSRYTFRQVSLPIIDEKLSKNSPNNFKFIRNVIGLEIKFQKYPCARQQKRSLKIEQKEKQKNRKIQIQINAGIFETGGQIVRTSLALSQILDKSMHCFDIRRWSASGPGINPVLKALFKAYSNLELEEGQSQLLYFPSGKDINKIVGNSRTSITLLMQSCLLISTMKNHKSLTIQGLVYFKFSPVIGSLKQIIFDFLQKIGIKINYEIILGEKIDQMKINIERQGRYLKPLILDQFSPPKLLCIYHLMSDQFQGQTNSQVKTKILKILNDYGYKDIQVKEQFIKVSKSEIKYEISSLIRGDRLYLDLGCQQFPEKFQQSLTFQKLKNFHEKKFCIDNITVDQIMIYLALAKGKSRIKCQGISSHIRGIKYILSLFLPEVSISKYGDILEIQGIGLQMY